MNPQHLVTFNNKVSIIDSYGVAMGTDPGMSKEILAKLANLKDPYTQAAAESTKIKYLGAAMICGADQGRYVKLVEELQNDFTKGNGDYPANTLESYILLGNYKTSYELPTIFIDN